MIQDSMEEHMISYTDALDRICAKANLNDGWVVSCDLECTSDERIIVCQYLKDKGYIDKYTFLGKSSVRCYLTDQGIAHAKAHKD